MITPPTPSRFSRGTSLGNGTAPSKINLKEHYHLVIKHNQIHKAFNQIELKCNKNFERTPDH